MATGLSRPRKSREGPGTGWDRTGPRDLEGPVVLWSRDFPAPIWELFGRLFVKKITKFAKNQLKFFFSYFASLFGKIFVLIVNLSDEP